MRRKRCNKCSRWKALNQFYLTKGGVSSSRCKKCLRRIAHKWRNDNRKSYNEWNRNYLRKHRHRSKAAWRAYLAYSSALNRKVRARVITHYGSQCVCCGEKDEGFLTVGHVNGGGTEFRRKHGLTASTRFYRWIITNNYPKDLRLECFNCNLGRAKNGNVCPHEQKDSYMILDISKLKGDLFDEGEELIPSGS